MRRCRSRGGRVCNSARRNHLLDVRVITVIRDISTAETRTLDLSAVRAAEIIPGCDTLGFQTSRYILPLDRSNPKLPLATQRDGVGLQRGFMCPALANSPTLAAIRRNAILPRVSFFPRFIKYFPRTIKRRGLSRPVTFQ